MNSNTIPETMKKEAFDYESGKEIVEPSWKIRVKEFFDNSTFNGTLYIFASKSWLKRIVWGLILLLAIVGFSVVTILDIIQLTREPIGTSITLTRERELDFPAVTVCSLSLLNTTTLESSGANVVDDLRNLFDFASINPSKCKTIANRLATTTGRNISWGELTNLAKNDLGVLLQSCTYEGKPCGVDDFRPISTVAGVCYTFNKPNSKARGTGVRSGLRLQLYPQDQLFSLEKDQGFRVVIHNPDELPRPESDCIAVGLNSTVYIGMRQVNSVDNTEYSSGHQCRTAMSVSRDLVSANNYTTYSQSSCLEECTYKFIADQCQCIERRFFTPLPNSRYNEFRQCTAPDFCCEVQYFESVGETCDCPPRCTTVERRLTVSSSTNRDGFVGVNVFYQSLILDNRKTSDSYTVRGLISDIGGNTGLFLGFSLLSGGELLLLVLGLGRECCSFCFKSKKWKLLRMKLNT